MDKYTDLHFTVSSVDGLAAVLQAMYGSAILTRIYKHDSRNRASFPDEMNVIISAPNGTKIRLHMDRWCKDCNTAHTPGRQLIFIYGAKKLWGGEWAVETARKLLIG